MYSFSSIIGFAHIVNPKSIPSCLSDYILAIIGSAYPYESLAIITGV